MSSAENSVLIDRPRSEVFAFVADHENDPSWRPGVLDIKRASGEGQGAVYTQGVQGPMGKRVDADFQVTAYQPDTLIAFRTLAGGRCDRRGATASRTPTAARASRSRSTQACAERRS